VEFCDVFSIGPDSQDGKIPVTAFAAFLRAFPDKTAFNLDHNIEHDRDRSFGFFQCVGLLPIYIRRSNQGIDPSE
jgi:hypothetical protein